MWQTCYIHISFWIWHSIFKHISEYTTTGILSFSNHFEIISISDSQLVSHLTLENLIYTFNIFHNNTCIIYQHKAYKKGFPVYSYPIINTYLFGFYVLNIIVWCIRTENGNVKRGSFPLNRNWARGLSSTGSRPGKRTEQNMRKKMRM